MKNLKNCNKQKIEKFAVKLDDVNILLKSTQKMFKGGDDTTEYDLPGMTTEYDLPGVITEVDMPI